MPYQSSGYNITKKFYLINTTYNIRAMVQPVYGHHNTKSRGEMTMEAKLSVVINVLEDE